MPHGGLLGRDAGTLVGDNYPGRRISPVRDIAVLAAALSKGHLAVSLLDAAAQTLAGLVLSTGDAASGAYQA